jgi:hypothetical protein
MQEDKIPAVERRSGKGVRAVLTTATITFLAEAMDTINTAWNDANTTDEAFEDVKAEWKTFATDSYGDRTWIGVPFRSEDELRITLVRKGGRLSFDIREWYAPH